MKLRVLILVFAVAFAVLPARAQGPTGAIPIAPPVSAVAGSRSNVPDLLDLPIVRPRMAPELALQVYEMNAERQLTGLGSSFDVTVVEATLPHTGQKGRFELRRSFLAPKSLAYGAIKFVGDGFVKTNIIIKLLTSEVEHVEKGDGRTMAITDENYKFSYKGTQSVNGQAAYEYRVKPRKKRAGLFKGKLFLDPTTARILRAEGTLVKSPSVFVKKVEFTQDYEQVAEFSLPAHLHSVAMTRLFGKAIVDISHSDYSAKPLPADHSNAGGNPSAASFQQEH